jgi:hypothetical protein
MIYFQAALSAAAGFVLALFGPLFVSSIHHFNEQTATGLGVVVREVASPIVWLLAGCFFIMFFFAGQAGSRTARVVLFWIPTTLIAVPGSALLAFIAYVIVQSRHV